MVFKITCTDAKRARRSAGFTLPEVVIAAGIGMICLAMLASLFAFSVRDFKSLGNYERLHSANRNAMDTLTREIRRADRVAHADETTLTLEDSDGASVTYRYSPSDRTLSRTKHGRSRVLLTGCDRLTFRLGERNPIGGSYDVFPAATAPTAKVVDVSWSCSRRVIGTRATTESVQTARIVIRKQST
jgi:type II secretory pathway component PulJ